MAKVSHRIPNLFLVLDADPKVAGHNRPIGTNGKFSEFKLLLAAIQHAWVYKANVGDGSKFFAVVIHCFLDFNTQRGAWIIVKP